MLPSARQLRQEIAADPAHPLAAAKADLLWTIETLGLRDGSRWPFAHPFKQCSVPACGLPASRAVHGSSGHRLRHHHQSSDVSRRGDRSGGRPTSDFRRLGGSARRRSSHLDRLGHHESAGVREGLERRERHSIAGRPQDARRASPGDCRRARRRRLGLEPGRTASSNPAYYLRFCKSFYRMGGTLDYIRCDNCEFLIHLLRRLGVK